MVIITVWHQPFPIQLEHMAGHFVISSDKMVDQRPRKEYVPQQVQKGPEREFTLNDWDEWFDEFFILYDS